METLKIGLLWFDDDPKRSLEVKISDGARRYREKFGKAPNACYVNPLALEKGKAQIGELQVVAARHILPHHFLLGIMDQR